MVEDLTENAQEKLIEWGINHRAQKIINEYQGHRYVLKQLRPTKD